MGGIVKQQGPGLVFLPELQAEHVGHGNVREPDPRRRREHHPAHPLRVSSRKLERDPPPQRAAHHVRTLELPRVHEGQVVVDEVLDVVDLLDPL